MARARNIKPAFFDNEYLAELPAINRLLFIGLWCLADREGRIEYRPKRIKAQLFAYDNCDMIEMISSLSECGFIQLYSVDGADYIQINKWSKHQNPHHKEVASVLPAPKGHEDTVCDGYIPMSNTIRNRTYSIHGRVCCCCGETNNLEIDHKMPISKGGNSIDSNLQVLCKRCNIKKFDNYIDFSKLPKDKLSMVRAWFMDDSRITQEQFNEIASILTDSLNLIPDSSSLIPSCEDSLVQPEAKPSKFKFDSYQMEFAEWMLSKLLILNPNFKKPNLESWANTLRLMIEVDKRDPVLIGKVFEWANNDEFWSSNILSANSLRKQFDKLVVKINQPQKAAKVSMSGGGDWAKYGDETF